MLTLLQAIDLVSSHPIAYPLSAILLSCIILYYVLRPYRLLRSSGFPYPSPVPLFGHQLALLKHGFQVCHCEWLKAWSDGSASGPEILAQCDGPNLSLLVADPSILTNVLISDFSTFPNRKLMILHQKCVSKSVIAQPYEEWRVGRKVLIGTFTTSMLKVMIARNVECTVELLRGSKDGKRVRRMSSARNISGYGIRNSNPTPERLSDTEPGYPLLTDRTPFEAKRLFGRYAIDIITRNALGFRLEIGSVEHKKFVDSAHKIFTFEMDRLAVLSWFKPLVDLVSDLFKVSFVGEASLLYIRDVIAKMASLRLKSDNPRKDLYQMMLDATNKINPNHSHKQAVGSDKFCPFLNLTEAPKTLDGPPKPFDTENVNANAIFIILAAYDTLSTALSWVVYHLASKPHLQDKVYREIVSELGRFTNQTSDPISPPQDSIDCDVRSDDVANDVHPKRLPWLTVNYETIKRLTYTEMFIKEVLRIDPPLAVVNRVSTRDYEVSAANDQQADDDVIDKGVGGADKSCYGGEGFPPKGSKDVKFKKGTLIDVPIYAIHHNPKYWPDPAKFDPERFGPNKSFNKCSYLPFGVGPRNCAAEKYAMLTMKAFLAVALQKIRYVKCPLTRDSYTPWDVPFKKNEFHYPKCGIWIAAEKR